MKQPIPFFRAVMQLCIFLLFILSTSSFADNGSKLREVMENISDYYVEQVDLKALQGQTPETLLKQLDPYSEYLDESKLEALFNVTNGRYTGLGIEVEERDSHIVILSSLNHSPAAMAGLQKGDILLAVNDTSVIARTIDEVTALIGDKRKIKLKIARAGHSSALEFELERREIEIESVTSQLQDDGTGYLRIISFNNHTYHDVARHLTMLLSQKGEALNGLLLDLRDNPGGILDSAIAISDLFLHHGIIVTTRGRFSDANHTFVAHYGDILSGAPIVVLINKGSASAAEILAGALKDNGRAVVAGTRSYGKGSVQSLIPLGDGATALKLTTARYFTPSGQSIEGTGITPDVAIEQAPLSQSDKAVIIEMEKSEYAGRNLTAFVDNQRAKAQQLLQR